MIVQIGNTSNSGWIVVSKYIVVQSINEVLHWLACKLWLSPICNVNNAIGTKTNSILILLYIIDIDLSTERGRNLKLIKENHYYIVQLETALLLFWVIFRHLYRKNREKKSSKMCMQGLELGNSAYIFARRKPSANSYSYNIRRKGLIWLHFKCWMQKGTICIIIQYVPLFNSTQGMKMTLNLLPWRVILGRVEILKPVMYFSCFYHAQ